jgi:hypothetical protein
MHIIRKSKVDHLRSMLDGYKVHVPNEFFFYKAGNKFQNLKVSSPAPVTTFLPHGLIAKIFIYKIYLNTTLYMCVQ